MATDDCTTLPFSEKTIARFWAKVRKDPDGCWRWTASADGGYGQIVFGRRGQQRRWGAHRFSWVLHCGQIPRGLGVLHTCDNGLCVNPEHLYLGTQGDNNRDMVARGRSCKGRIIPRICGSGNPNSRLTEEDVRDVLRRYRAGERQAALAHAFGVGKSTIGHLVRGETWRQIRA